ncbi:MAG: hypothetical protein RJA22_1485 [Verrucomicrobiota bacterium]|jgi:serine/threonine protein kinase
MATSTGSPPERPPASPPDASLAPIHPRPELPHLRLLRRIGRGAYGEVWLARNELGVLLATKLVYKDSFANPSPFEREYHGILQYTPLSRTHHGLVQILHVGRPAGAGYFYYVMELADCTIGGRDIDPDFYVPRTLAHEIDSRGRLPARETLQLGLDLAEALGYLHSRQLIHRDIKPANIIYVNGLPKLADVGLVTHAAEARREPKRLGTEGFVPPEGPGSPGADVYSLGKVLTEACLGRAGSAHPELPVAPEPGEEPGDLIALHHLLCKACAEDASLRHASIHDLEADLIALSEEWDRRRRS